MVLPSHTICDVVFALEVKEISFEGLTSIDTGIGAAVQPLP